jgi:hypothetical protein
LPIINGGGGSLADRLRAIVALYEIFKEADIDFKIYSTGVLLLYLMTG